MSSTTFQNRTLSAAAVTLPIGVIPHMHFSVLYPTKFLSHLIVHTLHVCTTEISAEPDNQGQIIQRIYSLFGVQPSALHTVCT